MKKVFVNGTFDILHLGHLALLDFARSQGDSVTVAIDSDARVKQLKGHTRPINTQEERAAMLLALRSVDHVVIFNSDQELVDLISKHDVMVKGSDYRIKPIVGSNVCKEIVFFERLNDYSTTNKIRHITTR